jgi:hypothetical protein
MEVGRYSGGSQSLILVSRSRICGSSWMKRVGWQQAKKMNRSQINKNVALGKEKEANFFPSFFSYFCPYERTNSASTNSLHFELVSTAAATASCVATLTGNVCSVLVSNLSLYLCGGDGLSFNSS